MITWYFLLLLMLFLFVIDYFGVRNKTRFNLITVFIIVVLSVLSGLRGNRYPDYQSYRSYFESVPSLIDFLFEGKQYIRLEPLYQLSISIFKIFSDNINLWLFVQALVLLVIVAVSLRRFRVPVNIGLIIYFLLLYLHQFAQQRMSIIFVLIIFATTYLVRNEFKKYALTVLVATGFHYISVAFFPAYFINHLILSKRRMRFHQTVTTKPASENPYYDEGKKYKQRMTSVTAWLMVPKTSLIIGFAMIVSLIINYQFDIFSPLHSLTSDVTSTSNIYLYKVASYYRNISTDDSLMDAWLGLLSFCCVILFIYIFRGHWLNEKNAPLFVNLCAGLILFIFTYQFNVMTDRLLRMYTLTSLNVIFAIMASNKGKNAIFTIPLIFMFCLYQFLSQIATETGAYNMMDF